MGTSPPHQNSTMSSLWELRRQKATPKIETKHKYIQTHRTKPKKIKENQKLTKQSTKQS